ncbi:hypothetical protein ADK92_13055 [Streptomyces sp. XY533]|nr:hypothetical protein ADK92_13055 [Streptomyces sp. XY533]
MGFGGEYDIPDVPHAMRLTNPGAFPHGNHGSSPDTFGTSNASHGCGGLRENKGAGSATAPGR